MVSIISDLRRLEMGLWPAFDLCASSGVTLELAVGYIDVKLERTR